MQRKSLRISSIAFCYLLGVLLLGPVAYGNSGQGSKAELATDNQLFEGQQLSYQTQHQQDHQPFPASPAELPLGKTEGDEESKEKDGTEDDSFLHRTLFNLSFTFTSPKSDNYFATIKTGGNRIPLFVLFHCWKSVLS